MKISSKAFVHKKAIVEGNIKIGENSSVWAGAVIRADEGPMRIGKNTSIQDNCVLHGHRVEIGDNVTVGHNAIVHGCTIGNNVIIGMGAIILDNAEIGDWCIIAAGSVVKENQKIPPNSLAAGVPAEVKRPLTEQDRERIKFSYKAYIKRLKDRNAPAG